MTAEIPSQFTHDVKLEETAKGLRIHVHVYANSMIEAGNQAIALYKSVRDKIGQESIPLAPMEVVTK